MIYTCKSAPDAYICFDEGLESIPRKANVWILKITETQWSHSFHSHKFPKTRPSLEERSSTFSHDGPV